MFVFKLILFKTSEKGKYLPRSYKLTSLTSDKEHCVSEKSLVS